MSRSKHPRPPRMRRCGMFPRREAPLVGTATHAQLLDACRDLEYGRTWRAQTVAGGDDALPTAEDLPDCSCGCAAYHALEGLRGADWGVCVEPRSPRCGLLTFEHMGCRYFQARHGEHPEDEL